MFSKRTHSETLAKHPVNDSDFVLLYIHRLARRIQRHSARPIRLLESPTALRVYILNIYIGRVLLLVKYCRAHGNCLIISSLAVSLDAIKSK